MKLSEIRGYLVEDGDGGGTSAGDVAGSPDASGTSTDDVATYAWPLFWGFGKDRHVRRSNQGLAHLGSMKGTPRKRRKNVREEYELKDEFVREMMGYVATCFDEKLSRYGFSVNVDDKDVSLIAPTGRLFAVRVYEGYILVTQPGAKIKMDPKVGIMSDKELFMVQVIPGGKAGYDDGEPMSYDVAVERFVNQSWYYVLKYDMLMTVAPFVDLSVKEPLPKEDLEELHKRFVVIDSKDWKGTFNHLEFYRHMFGDKMLGDRRVDEKANEDISREERIKDLAFYKPVNIWKNKTDYNPVTHMIDEFLEVEWNRIVPTKKNHFEVWWDDELRVRLSPNGVGILEANMPNGIGGRTWCVIHGIPWIPSEFVEEYLAEAKAFIAKYKMPKSYSEFAMNWPDLIHQVWTSNADEPPYMGGVCYHRDGIWGIDYYMSGFGRGASDTGAMDLPIVSYQFKLGEDGTLSATSYATYKIGTTYDIGQWDINVNFHPTFPVERIVRFMRRFTYSS